MTVIVQGDQIAQIVYGTKVANAAAGKTVPQNATGTIFTVSGGRILVSALLGVVTTVIAGTTPALKLIATPTVGTANDMCTALTITAAEAGALFSLPTGVGSALNGHVAKSGSVTLGGGQVVATGTIGQNVSAADATGAIRWTLFYVPLDSGASVVTA